ncbi:ArsR family transcriptional regulator [Haloarcula sp. Atlit-47R]|nr:ArsR family transcriptional regulator [Haloarcula sp. Atlit-47R]
MRPVFGLTESDRSILQLLADSGIAVKPGTIRYNLRVRYDTEIAKSTIHRRLPNLIHAGLVELEDEKSSRYAITALGERLLAENLSDDEVMQVSQRVQEGPPDDS